MCPFEAQPQTRPKEPLSIAFVCLQLVQEPLNLEVLQDTIKFEFDLQTHSFLNSFTLNPTTRPISSTASATNFISFSKSCAESLVTAAS